MVKAADAVRDVVVANKGQCRDLSSWGLNKSWAEGGDDPCEDIWVHDCDEEAPHWHYVTSGLADPGKHEGRPGESGLGYELSFRLAREPGETEAPDWPWKRLQELGWGILKANMRLGEGHYLRRRSVITGGNPPTQLQGYYLIKDPRLTSTECESGSIQFLQVVGVTEEELLRCESGEPDEMEAELRQLSPLGITDLSRTAPEIDEIDFLELNALQSRLANQCVETLPDGVAELSFTTRVDEDGAFSHETEGDFSLSHRADATVKRIFALQRSAGQDVAAITTQLTRRPDGDWHVALDFEYED